MSVPEIVSVVQKWRDVYITEGKFLRNSGSPDGYVQIFEVSPGISRQQLIPEPWLYDGRLCTSPPRASVVALVRPGRARD